METLSNFVDRTIATGFHYIHLGYQIGHSKLPPAHQAKLDSVVGKVQPFADKAVHFANTQPKPMLALKIGGAIMAGYQVVTCASEFLGTTLTSLILTGAAAAYAFKNPTEAVVNADWWVKLPPNTRAEIDDLINKAQTVNLTDPQRNSLRKVVHAAIKSGLDNEAISTASENHILSLQGKKSQ